MASAKFFSAKGEPGDARELPTDPFDGVVNEAVLHQAIKAHLANQRHGNASTKTRGLVAGGNKKIWRQKGTGRARQGSIRAPHWKGGGVVFGPHPRSYRQDLPRKVRVIARRSAFNTRANNEQVSVIESLTLSAPKTRGILDLLTKIGIGERKVLILTNGVNSNVILSARNLPNVDVLPYRDASAYDVLTATELLIEAEALGEPGESAPAKKPRAAKSTAKQPAAKKAAATKSTAKKTTAKKPTAKKTTAKKATAEETTAKKSTAKKSTKAAEASEDNA
jgi:large subunit ribosomal protein L4